MSTDNLKSVQALQFKPAVQRIMDLARRFRSAHGEDYDDAYKALEGAAYEALIAQLQREAVQPVAQVEMVASQHERRLSWEAFQSVRAAPHLDRAAVIASGEAQGEKSGVATNGDGSEGWNAGVGLVPIQEGSLRSAVGAELLGGRASELDTGRRGQRDAELRSTESLDAVAPCAASVTRSAAATPHPEARAAQPTQDERNLAAARLPHLLKPGHGLPNDFRLVPRQPEAQALDSQLQQPDADSTRASGVCASTTPLSDDALSEAYAEGRKDEREDAIAAMQRTKIAYYMHGRDQAAEFARHAGYPELAASIAANWAAPGWLPPLCQSCDGSGEREVFVRSGGSMPENAADGYDETVNCPACDGSGFACRRSAAGAQQQDEQAESASPSVLLIRGEK